MAVQINKPTTVSLVEHMKGRKKKLQKCCFMGTDSNDPVVRRREQLQQQQQEHEKEEELKQLARLRRERDSLRKQVSSLAKFNYAREPEFVRNRTNLKIIAEEVSSMLEQATSKYIEPTLRRLNEIQRRLTEEAIRHEELSESMAQDFLIGKIDYNEFLNEYVKLRKETSCKRIVADKLAKEKSSLANDLIMMVPGAAFAVTRSPSTRDEDDGAANNADAAIAATNTATSITTSTTPPKEYQKSTQSVKNPSSPIPTPRQRKRISLGRNSNNHSIVVGVGVDNNNNNLDNAGGAQYQPH